MKEFLMTIGDKLNIELILIISMSVFLAVGLIVFIFGYAKK